MTTERGAVAEPTRRRPREHRPAGRLGMVGAGTAILITGLTWWATRLGNAPTVVLSTVVATACGALIVHGAGRSTRPPVRGVAVTATVALGAGLVALTMSGTLVAAKLGATIDTWTVEAQGLLERPDAEPYECESFTSDQPELPAFGRVDGRCTSREGAYRTVWYTQRDPMGGWTGLLYSPDTDRAPVQSQCVAHLDGPWWQTASADPECPLGFTFIGGG